MFDCFVNILFFRCRDNIDEFMKSCFNTENKPGEKTFTQGWEMNLNIYPNLDRLYILAFALELLKVFLRSIFFGLNKKA